jgi:Zn-dependent protease
MFGRRFDLFKLFGIPLRVDLSWFVVVVLLSWSLATNVFPSIRPDLGVAVYWWMGVLGALGLFVSVVLHELAHAVVARRFGIAIRGITLFIFGGVAEFENETPVAGTGAPPALTGVFFYLAAINLLLVVFNMIPAFPLDGGRVLRSALWQWKKDLPWATGITSRIGSGFGMLLIAYGIFLVVARQDLFGGMWMFLIGMFLRNAAQMSYRQLMMRRSLEGEPVRRFMKIDPVAVPRSISVAELVDDYIYRHHYKFFPVVDGERLSGCVTTRRVKELPREEWSRQTVGSIVEPCTSDNTVGPDSDAMEALAKMSRSGASRLMVVEDGRLLGIIALKDLLRFLALKIELEGRDADTERPA